jgi:hypothetical protein
VPVRGPLDSGTTVHQERDYGSDQEDDEQNFGDSCSAGREAAKTENRCNERNDEKHDGIVKHGGT